MFGEKVLFPYFLQYLTLLGIDGQLGIAKAKDISSPTPVPSFSNGIRRVSCGQAHSIAIADNGDSYSWGSNPSSNSFKTI